MIKRAVRAIAPVQLSERKTRISFPSPLRGGVPGGSCEAAWLRGPCEKLAMKRHTTLHLGSALCLSPSSPEGEEFAEQNVKTCTATA